MEEAIYKMFWLRVDPSLIFFPNNVFTFLKEFLLRYQNLGLWITITEGRKFYCVFMRVRVAPRKLYRKFGGTNSAISYRSRRQVWNSLETTRRRIVPRSCTLNFETTDCETTAKVRRFGELVRCIRSRIRNNSTPRRWTEREERKARKSRAPKTAALTKLFIGES